MAGGMPPAGGTQGPTPAYPAYPGYGYGASPWEADRQKQINRTKTGLLLLLIGTLIGWIPVIGLLGGLLVLIGAILVILGRKAFGAGHSRNVVLAIVLFFVGVIGTVVLSIVFFAAITAASVPGATPATVANAFVNAFNNLLIGVIIVSAIAGIGRVLFTYALQQQIGKILLWAGYVANVAIAIAVFAIISPLFASAVSQAIAGGTYNSAPLLAVQNQANALGLLSVIPALLFAAATYLAWSRVNRGEIPPPAVPPGMPSGMPTAGSPPSGPAPPM
jgi:hypothetical protein